MNRARLAVRLVEQYGLSHKLAMKVVAEGDSDAAAQAMAQNATDDPEKQKDLEQKFKDQIDGVMSPGDDSMEQDDVDYDDDNDDDDDDLDVTQLPSDDEE